MGGSNGVGREFWTLESTKWDEATRYCNMTAFNALYHELWSCK
jgi:hypothetical protein